MQGSSRRYDMYNLRVLAFGLVFVYHLCRIFSPFHGWPVQNPTRSVPLGLLNIWLEPYIATFFLLGGAGTWYSLSRRSVGRYLWERVTRLFLPLMFGALVIVPPQIYYERLRRGQFEGSYLEFYPSVFTNGLYPSGNLGWHHLWFLAYLMTFSIIAIPILLYFQSDSGNRVINRLAAWIQKPGRIFLFAVPLAITEIIFRARWPGYENLVGDWANFSLFLTVFIYGYVFASDDRFQAVLDRYWKQAMWLSFACTAVTLALYATENIPRDYSVFYAVHRVIFAVGVWSALIFFWGGSHSILNQSNRFWSYTLNISYPFYVFHQTIIVAFAYYVLQWDLPVYFKLLLIGAPSFVLTLVFCEVVKLTHVTRFLFGVRHRRIPRDAVRAGSTT